MIQKFEIITQGSNWYLLLCLSLGLFYAFIFYYKSLIENKLTKWLLASFRFLVVSIISFLLLSPLVKTVTNEFEKPIFLIALDNSESVGMMNSKLQQKDIISKLKQLIPSIQKQEADIQFKTIDNQTDINSNINFNVKSSNYSELLSNIENEFENRNLVEVILAGDGIFNEGISPTYKNYPFKISTIGLGDTVQKRDISISNLKFNKTTFLGNKFPFDLDVSNYGFENTNVNINILHNNKTIAQQNIVLSKNTKHVHFLLDASAKGMQHYVIEIKPIKGEYTTQNNIKHAYIEVIDGKEKVLIIAAAPHPDIKALKSTLDKIDNVELSIYMPEINTYKEDKYDLIILHQIPNIQGIGNDILQKVLQKNTPILYILGIQSDINKFNTINNISKLNSRGRNIDKVMPYFNTGFDKFLLDESIKNQYSKFPPLSIPFGDIQLSSNTETILFQKIGNINSTKPLLVYSLQGDRKTAVLFGEGIWQWRAETYEQSQNHEAFDVVFAKLTQLLSQKDDKRKFRTYPVNSEILSSESMTFDTEIYNDIYEPIYGQKINLSIKSENGKTQEFSFIHQKDAPRFEVQNLKQGIYKYSASTILNGKKEISQGEFTVTELQLEVFNTTADHNLLRELSKKTGGQFVKFNQIETLAQKISKVIAKQKIHSSEELLEIINLKWIFFFILLLITSEWVIRKAIGSGV